MPRKVTRHRQPAAQRAGEERARYLARRIGVSVREARLALGLRQVDVAARAGVTQAHVSRIERGAEPHAALATLASIAAGVDVQLAAFIQAMPGADLPRDIEHLRRQRLILAAAAKGGWTGQAEAVVAQDGAPARSIDVLLTRQARRECVVVEIWNLLPDVGAALRGLDEKVLAIRGRLDGWHVEPLLVVRGTRRNRMLVRELRGLFAARYPASSTAWLRSLADRDVPMPNAAGFLWTSVTGGELGAAHLG